MGSAPRPEAVVITGPTGTGKSELAVEVAERLPAEVISADSRQVYRFMDIGTAKTPPSLRQRVRHHGLDLFSPAESYSAGRFARDAWDWIADVRGRGRTPLIVGGSGFFIRALLAPLGPEPGLDRGRMTRLRAFLADRPVAELKTWLRRLDPSRAEELQGEGGPQRLSRSLEVALLSGHSHSWWLRRPPETRALSAVVFCLSLPREELYRRIDQRYDCMMAAGLLEEVRNLLERFGETAPGLRSVGYAELRSHLMGELSLTAAVQAAKRATRQFARRQATWCRHQLPEDTIWLDARRPRSELVSLIVQEWESASGRLAPKPRGR